ncbi:hypothetical protein H6G36_21035 [Anabaena minutissima FACHB-250]|nr:hypothetical protein [Anabaena minutissima FACHB-250]
MLYNVILLKPARTHYSSLSTQHSALSTQHSALSTQHSALSTQHFSLFFDSFRNFVVNILSILFNLSIFPIYNLIQIFLATKIPNWRLKLHNLVD